MDPKGEGFMPEIDGQNFPELERPLGVDAQNYSENGSDGQNLPESNENLEGQHLPELEELDR